MMPVNGFWNRLDEALRGAGLYIILVVAGVAIFFLAYNLGNFSLPVLVAAAITFACLIALFIAAQRKPQPLPPPRPREESTLLTPTVVVNEVRAAALVTYGEIGTVTVKKERDKANEGMVKPLHDKIFGQELVMDVGVRVVAGVNLKHLREEDVRVGGKSVEITLPPTKVLMVYVDESLTRVVHHKIGWLTERDISMMDRARREAMEALVNAAIDKGLLDKAGEQAATAIAGIARGLGFEEIKVYPMLPPMGAHFEELQDPSLIAKLKAEPPPMLPREDQAGD
jgi:hypothetical protein